MNITTNQSTCSEGKILLAMRETNKGADFDFWSKKACLGVSLKVRHPRGSQPSDEFGEQHTSRGKSRGRGSEEGKGMVGTKKRPFLKKCSEEGRLENSQGPDPKGLMTQMHRISQVKVDIPLL